MRAANLAARIRDISRETQSHKETVGAVYDRAVIDRAYSFFVAFAFVSSPLCPLERCPVTIGLIDSTSAELSGGGTSMKIA